MFGEFPIIESSNSSTSRLPQIPQGSSEGALAKEEMLRAWGFVEAFLAVRNRPVCKYLPKTTDNLELIESKHHPNLNLDLS